MDLANIVIGDDTRTSIVIGFDAEVIRALHHALFQRFAAGTTGIPVTFHIRGNPNIERHFFITPGRGVHFMYRDGKLPELNEDTVKTIENLIDAGMPVHIPLDSGVDSFAELMVEGYRLGSND